MSYQQKPPTSRTPHNKSERARDAEGRGEHTWTNWRQKYLIDGVLRVNRKGLTARDLRTVRPFELLKVQLLVATEVHHVRLRIEELQAEMVQYYGINMKLAESLSVRGVRKWSAARPSEDELDRMVIDKTGRLYYRQRR